VAAGSKRYLRRSATRSRDARVASSHWLPYLGTNQVRRAIERVSLHRLQTKLNLQIWRHNTVAIIQRYVKDRDVPKTLGYGDDETDEVENDAFDLLEQLQGKGAQFRSCQQPVIEAVMQ
jgi:hypothetical protein